MLTYVSNMELSDQDIKIITCCIKGQQDAWNKLVNKFSGLVIWSVRTRLAKSGYSFTDADVEDIHQEVFVSLYTGKLKTLKDKSKLPGWLAIICGGIAISYMRQKGIVAQKSVSLFCETTGDQNSGLTTADTLEADDPPICEEIDKKLQQEILSEIIESLNYREKIILNLYFIHNNSIREIAQNLSLPEGTVASIIARTKDKLKAQLKQKDLL